MIIKIIFISALVAGCMAQDPKGKASTLFDGVATEVPEPEGKLVQVVRPYRYISPEYHSRSFRTRSSGQSAKPQTAAETDLTQNAATSSTEVSTSVDDVAKEVPEPQGKLVQNEKPKGNEVRPHGFMSPEYYTRSFHTHLTAQSAKPQTAAETDLPQNEATSSTEVSTSVDDVAKGVPEPQGKLVQNEEPDKESPRKVETNLAQENVPQDESSPLGHSPIPLDAGKEETGDFNSKLNFWRKMAGESKPPKVMEKPKPALHPRYLRSVQQKKYGGGMPPLWAKLPSHQYLPLPAREPEDHPEMPNGLTPEVAAQLYIPRGPVMFDNSRTQTRI